MAENKVDYKDYALDPSKDVLVPLSTYIAMTNIVQEVEKKHSTRVRTDIYAFFSKLTHVKLTHKAKVKMEATKLAAEYYENIDMEASVTNVRVDRDELGSAAVQMLGELRGIFQLNVDKGNAVLRSVLESPVSQGPAETEGVGKVEAPINSVG
jgi:hypothetical protein